MYSLVSRKKIFKSISRLEKCLFSFYYDFWFPAAECTWVKWDLCPP